MDQQQRLLERAQAGTAGPEDLPGAGMSDEAKREAFLPYLSKVACTVAQDALAEACNMVQHTTLARQTL